MEKNEKVFAVRNATDKLVYIYGVGTYLGDMDSPKGIPNPCIKLDDGKTIWGYQCWWGPMSRYEEFIQGRKVLTVPLEDDYEERS